MSNKGANKFTGKALATLQKGRAPEEHPLTDSDFSSREYISEIPLDKIRPNPTQARIIFDEAALNELAVSIRSKGVIKPIIVQEITKGQDYFIVAGERRWRASKIAGLTRIRSIIKHDSEDNDIIGLIENIQREDLVPVEECLGYQKLKERGMSQIEIAGSIGKSEPHISKAIKIAGFLTKLKDHRDIVKLRLSDGKHIGFEHLYTIASAPDFDKACSLLEEIISKKITRDEAREKTKQNRRGGTSKSWDNIFRVKLKKLNTILDFNNVKVKEVFVTEDSAQSLIGEIDKSIDIMHKTVKDLIDIKENLSHKIK